MTKLEKIARIFSILVVSLLTITILLNMFSPRIIFKIFNGLTFISSVTLLILSSINMYRDYKERKRKRNGI